MTENELNNLISSSVKLYGIDYINENTVDYTPHRFSPKFEKNYRFRYRYGFSTMEKLLRRTTTRETRGMTFGKDIIRSTEFRTQVHFIADKLQDNYAIGLDHIQLLNRLGTAAQNC